MVAVEEFELADDDASEERPTHPAARQRSRLAPWIAASVALVLLGSAAATPVPLVLGRGEGLDVGMLGLDLSVPPSTVWESSAMTYPNVLDAGPDRAVVVANEDQAGRDIVGLALTDGGEVWRYHDEGYTCQFSVPVVCVQDQGSPDARIVVIDTHDGSRHERPHAGALGAIVAGEDLVVVEVADRPIEDVMEVEATETRIEMVVLIEPDGSERWRVRADAAMSEQLPVWINLRISDDVVVLDMTGVALDLASGEVSTEPPVYRENGLTFEFVGDLVVVTGPDGRMTMSADENVLRVDDDLGGPVRLEQDEAGMVVVATLRSDETELWRSTEGLCYAMARLRGTVVMECWGTRDAGVFGVDELTGERLWSQAGAGWPMLASSSTIVFMDYGKSRLVAVDPAHGTTLWSLDVTGSDLTGSVTALADGVLLSTETTVLRLSWR